MSLAHAILLQREQPPNDASLAGLLENASQIVKTAYSQCPSYDVLVPALLQYPLKVGETLLDFGCTKVEAQACGCLSRCGWHFGCDLHGVIVRRESTSSEPFGMTSLAAGI